MRQAITVFVSLSLFSFPLWRTQAQQKEVTLRVSANERHSTPSVGPLLSPEESADGRRGGPPEAMNQPHAERPVPKRARSLVLAFGSGATSPIAVAAAAASAATAPHTFAPLLFLLLLLQPRLVLVMTPPLATRKGKGGSVLDGVDQNGHVARARGQPRTVGGELEVQDFVSAYVRHACVVCGWGGVCEDRAEARTS